MKPETRQIIDTRSQVIQRVKRNLITSLSLPFEEDDLHEDISLLGSGLGLDSLDALELILGIQREFGVKVEEGNIGLLRSINTLVDYLLDNNATIS